MIYSGKLPASQMDQMESLLQCIGKSNANSIDTFFLIYASSLVFFIQACFAMLCAGCVQLKNVQNSMLKNLLDTCGAALGFWSVGYAFAYGGMDCTDPKQTFIGTEHFFLMGVDDLMFWVFQFDFAGSATTIVDCGRNAGGTMSHDCVLVLLSYPDGVCISRGGSFRVVASGILECKCC